MTPAEARSAIAEALAAIAPEAELETLTGREDLREALDLDSMDFLNLVVALSERCARPIPEADQPRLHTLQGAIDYLVASG